MTPDDEDLESRLRHELTAPRSADRIDAEDFLSGVHHGAKVRRRKRTVSVAAAGVLAIAGAGLALNTTGILNGSPTPVATSPSEATTPVTDGPSTPSSIAPSSPRGTTANESPTPSKESVSPVNGPVTISAHGPISAADVHPVSLTATGNDHQWVLAETPGGQGCTTSSCATLLVTTDHGARWKDVGQLPAPPASSDATTPTSVSQVRFAKQNDTTYDGWAYGDALWSTHDSGRTWSAAQSPAGQVTQLEAWGDYVYAGVTSAEPGAHSAQLYRSPTATDEWTPVPVGGRLTNVQALAAAQGVVGLIDAKGLRSVLYVSRNGTSWERQRACPTGSQPQTLSTATDPSKGIGSLWVTCTTATTTTVVYMDTDSWGSWQNVAGTFGAADLALAARTPDQGFVAGGDTSGIDKVASGSTPVSVPGVDARDVGSPVFFGFTNDGTGYLLSSAGSILSTTDGGTTWAPYAVTDTP